MELPDAAAEAVKNDLRDIFNMAGYSYYFRPNALLRRRNVRSGLLKQQGYVSFFSY
jgi:hypothetical protein